MNISNKKFVVLLFIFVLLTFYAAHMAYILNLKMTDNGIIKEDRYQKLTNKKYIGTRVVVVGDSSAGNAIDEKLYTSLSGKKTTNLALTGSYGLIGTLNMIKNSHIAFPHLEEIIIIHTFDIWRRPFSYEGHVETGDISFVDKFSSDYFEYKFGVKNINLFFKMNFGEYIKPTISGDFLKQDINTYSNGMKKFDPKWKISDSIHTSNLKLLLEIDAFCSQNNLNCIFVHGPIMRDLYNNSTPAVDKINATIKSNGLLNINIVDSAVILDINMTGDSTDHVDLRYKEDTTKKYYKLIENY